MDREQMKQFLLDLASALSDHDLIISWEPVNDLVFYTGTLTVGPHPGSSFARGTTSFIMRVFGRPNDGQLQHEISRCGAVDDSQLVTYLFSEPNASIMAAMIYWFVGIFDASDKYNEEDNNDGA